jgi:hypothetical protein
MIFKLLTKEATNFEKKIAIGCNFKISSYIRSADCCVTDHSSTIKWVLQAPSYMRISRSLSLYALLLLLSVEMHAQQKIYSQPDLPVEKKIADVVCLLMPEQDAQQMNYNSPAMPSAEYNGV